MKSLIYMLVFIISASVAYAQIPDAVIQIATVKTDGVWIDWTDLPEISIAWAGEVVASIPPHNPIDNDPMQDWYLPFQGMYHHLVFERNDPGEYAIRWKVGSGLWSEFETCAIIAPGKANHQ